MKTLIITFKMLILITLFTNVTLYAKNMSGITPNYDRVYQTGRIGDAYYFFLLSKDGNFYHLYTNKTSKLSTSELKSSKILKILKKKQSWGKAIANRGAYTKNHGRIYTKLLWNEIKILSKKKIKYLNKIYTLK